MDPLTIATLVGGGASLLGGLAGASAAQSGADEQARLQRQAIARLAGVPIPTVEELSYNPEDAQYVMGELENLIEQERATELTPSEMESVAADPRLVASQMAALEQLSGLAEGGLSEADLAGLQQVRRGAASEAQAQQEAILQNMAQRGQAGSGAELIAKLKSGQAAADRAGSQGLEIARMAQQRALQALSNQGSMAGQIRGQDVSEQAQRARAADQISQWNAAQAASREQRRAGATTGARMSQAEMQQQLEQQRAANRTAQRQAQAQAQTQRTNMLLNQAGGQASQLNQMGQAQAQAGANRGAAYSRAGQGIGQAIMGMYGTDDKKDKTTDVDAWNKFLNQG